MFKYLLVAGIALATVVFAFDDPVCLVPVDNTGDAPTSTAYIPTPSYGRDVIYDDQTYDYDYCYSGVSIYGAANYETADDFIPEDDVTINEVVIWISAQGVDLRCDFFEGSSSGPGDEEDPTVTDMYPLDDDWPSGVPPSDNTSGCHWQDGDPDTNEGIDVDASYFKIYDAGMDLVTGMLDIDDADLWDVVVDFEGDDPWEEGATYTVETETYDLAGNGPVTEIWTFDVGYTNVVEKSFGAIKAGFIE